MTKYYPNKYKGVCTVCGGTVAAYAGLCHLDGGWKTSHEACIDPKAAEAAKALQQANEKKEAERIAAVQAKANYKRMLKDKLGLGKQPVEPGKLQQLAYNDIWTATYQYAGDLTDTEIRFAINSAHDKSSTKVVGLDIPNKRITIETNTYVPD